MPTSRGWTVAFVGAFTVFAGRAFGIIELFVIGLGLLVLVAGAWAIVRFVRLRLEVAREVTPLRVHAGGTAKVELRVTNLGRARSPLLALTDPVAGTKGARLHVAPLRRKAAARAAYLTGFATIQAIKEFDSSGTNAASWKQTRDLLEPTLTPATYNSVRATHVISDILTIGALWAMELRRRRLKRQRRQAGVSSIRSALSWGTIRPRDIADGPPGR